MMLKRQNQSDAQREFISKMRNESIVDPRVPLNQKPYLPFPELGPTAQAYFRDKVKRLRESQ